MQELSRAFALTEGGRSGCLVERIPVICPGKVCAILLHDSVMFPTVSLLPHQLFLPGAVCPLQTAGEWHHTAVPAVYHGPGEWCVEQQHPAQSSL